MSHAGASLRCAASSSADQVWACQARAAGWACLLDIGDAGVQVGQAEQVAGLHAAQAGGVVAVLDGAVAAGAGRRAVPVVEVAARAARAPSTLMPRGQQEAPRNCPGKTASARQPCHVNSKGQCTAHFAAGKMADALWHCGLLMCGSHASQAEGTWLAGRVTSQGSVRASARLQL